RGIGAGCLAQHEDQIDLFFGLELYFPLQRRAWIECGATASRELAIDRERDRGGEMTVASDELLPIASQAVGGRIPGSKGGPAPELAFPRVCGKTSPPLR